MTFNARFLLALGGVLVVVALAASTYVFRGRLLAGDSSRTADGIASAPTSPAAAARGEITIDPQRQQLTGVRLADVTRGPIEAAVRTTGVVRYDERRLFDVNVKLDGWIRDLYADFTGQRLELGQPLFTLYSPDLLATQNEFLLALTTRDRVQASPIADTRDYANRLVDAARERLRLWDLSSEDIARLESSRKPLEAVTFRSPARGYVIEKAAVKGMRVTPGQTLYRVADLSLVWVEADIYEQDVALARVGQRATVTLDAYPGEPLTGRAIYVYPFVEPNSRTVKVRFQFPNASGRLKPGMYADIDIQGSGGMGLTVPSDAVLDSGAEQVVFVAEGDGRFTPRQVTVGRRLGDRVEILQGLAEGQQVAAGATFFLDSESQMRAGLQNYEAPQPAAAAAADTAASDVAVTFRTSDDVPRPGENAFEVTVHDARGQPVSDAQVTVQLFMPAMPTMNMPAMRNETTLAHVGGGTYRGAGHVMMAGRWDVTVTVTRNAQRVASRQFGLVAR
jgi:RND family efflux transporter MFP subunit